ncbi:MAG: hypothetical protein QW292_11935 [Candidatus Parvarchaeota archaeon]
MGDVKSIVDSQIYFLRLLTRYDSNISVSLTGKSKWLNLYDVIRNPPNFPITSRSILRNELVLEIDDDSWETVRDGTRKIIYVLERWKAEGSYYLSFSGHNSIHIHLFFDPSSLKINDDTLKVLEGVDKDEIRKEVKAYIMRQVSLATDTSIDLNLSSVRHLIRLEGSVNEKSGKPCSMINTIPDDRHTSYSVKVPDSLPSKVWNISFLEDELNAYLKIHFSKNEKLVHYGPGKPIGNPERLANVLKPIYVQGYRHHIVLSLSGYLKRHSVPLVTAQGIVKQLANRDEEFSSRLYSLREIYKADNGKRIPGLPKLIEITMKEAKEEKITQETAESVISQLEAIAGKGGSKHETR